MKQPQFPCSKCGADLFEDPEMAMLFWDYRHGQDHVADLQFCHKMKCDPEQPGEKDGDGGFGLSMELAWMIGAPLARLWRMVEAYPFNRQQILRLIGLANACSLYKASEKAELIKVLGRTADEEDALLRELTRLAKKKLEACP